MDSGRFPAQYLVTPHPSQLSARCRTSSVLGYVPSRCSVPRCSVAPQLGSRWRPARYSVAFHAGHPWSWGTAAGLAHSKSRHPPYKSELGDRRSRRAVRSLFSPSGVSPPALLLLLLLLRQGCRKLLHKGGVGGVGGRRWCLRLQRVSGRSEPDRACLTHPEVGLRDTERRQTQSGRCVADTDTRGWGGEVYCRLKV